MVGEAVDGLVSSLTREQPSKFSEVRINFCSVHLNQNVLKN